MGRAPFTAQYLRSLLDYDPQTGILLWHRRPIEAFRNKQAFSAWNTKYAGKVAGSSRPDGYVCVSIDKRRYLAHRLIVFMINGRWPDVVDHINGDPSDNRAFNLRDTDAKGNARNNSISSANTSGFTGVIWDKSRGKWAARIKFSGKLFHLGRFSQLQDAVDARKEAARLNGFHPNHGRSCHAR